MSTPIFTVTVASDTLPKLQADLYRIARELGGEDSPPTHPAVETAEPQPTHEPAPAPSEPAPAPSEPAPAPNGAAQPQAGPPAEGMTVANLTAMVNKKETASTALADGSRAKAGDYVLIGNENWYVDKTFRGTLIVTNEAGRSEAVNTEHCYPSSHAGAPPADEEHPAAEKPRPGTAGAFAQIEKPSPSQVDDARSRAAALCIASKASPDQVFAKLKEAGSESGKFDDLNVEGFNSMLTWISGLEAPAEETTQASTGFGF